MQWWRNRRNGRWLARKKHAEEDSDDDSATETGKKKKSESALEELKGCEKDIFMFDERQRHQI